MVRTATQYLCGAALLLSTAAANQECQQEAVDDASLLQLKEHQRHPDPWWEPQANPWWAKGWKPKHPKKPCTSTTTTPVPPPAPPTPAPQPPCPYDFTPPKCEVAEPQTPRDLTPGAVGKMTPKAATLNDAQVEFLPLANIHFHLGAEHKSTEYDNGTESKAYDAKYDPKGEARTKAGPRPGWMCPVANLTKKELKPYEFKYCKKNVYVGKSYEVHYVHSSAGYSKEDIDGADIGNIDDGLGGAANGRGQLNPMIAVEAQIFQIVNGGPNLMNLAEGWKIAGVEKAVMYPGSTTGTSFDNEVCSPYAITWHVDLVCHKISPESFDELCREMKQRYGLKKDLNAKGSRILVDEAFVVKEEFVLNLA